MKIDKESFFKHHFWYLLGILIPLTFLALILLVTGTAGAIQDYEKKYDAGKKAIDALTKSQPKNQKWVEVLDQKARRAEEEKNKIWKQMWDTQADLMTWPPALAEKFKNLYFGDKIDLRDRNTYAKEDQYVTQYQPIIDLVQPVKPDGSGVMQCVGGNWFAFLRAKGWVNPPPTTEDIWLLQEDLWLRRELLRIVREANDAAANFTKVTSDKTVKAADELDRQTFLNPVWKFDVGLASKGGKFLLRYRLTNISRRRQWLGLNFQVSFHGTRSVEKVFVDDEPLAPGKWLDKEQPLGFGSQLGNPDALDSVRQIYDWKTAPVKRIDALDLQHQSSRTAGAPFVQRAFPLLAGDATQGSSPAGQNTAEGLLRDRYLQVTEPVRRFSIGVLLIVDQASMQDVLTAFANSHLHFQTTQWHWKRFYGDVKPPLAPVLARPNAPPPPPQPGPSPDEVGEADPIAGRRARAASQPTPAPAAVAAARSAAADDRDLELVELAVYGIGSLYERYPPKGAAPAK
jgi:hypothetical protein